MLHKV